MRVGGFLGLLLSSRSRLTFPGFDLGLIFRLEDAGALQIFHRVNVLGFFLLAFFARAFLTSGLGDVLGVALRGAEDGAGENQDAGQVEARGTNRCPHGGQVSDRNWAGEFRYCHGKRTRYGGHRLGGSIAKFKSFGKGNIEPAGRRGKRAGMSLKRFDRAGNLPYTSVFVRDDFALSGRLRLFGSR